MKKINSLNSLLKEIRRELEENNLLDSVGKFGDFSCIELVSDEMISTIKEYALEHVKLSHEECGILWNIKNGAYPYCNSKDEVKIELVIDAVDYNLSGKKITIIQLKKQALELSGCRY